MAVTATTVVVDKSLTEAKAAKEGLIFPAVFGITGVRVRSICAMPVRY